MRAPILLAAVLASAAARADCPRDPLYPADVPWIPCPSRVMPAPCTRCLARDASVRIDAFYDDADPAALVDAIAAGLGSDWHVNRHTKEVLAAEAPGRRLFVRATAAQQHRAMLYVERGPR